RGRERRALALTLVLALALALDPGVDSFLRLAIIGIVNPERSVLKANGWPGLDSSSSAGAISTPAFNSIEEGHPVRIHRLFAPLALTFIAGTAIAAGPPAKITGLAWMTGTWAAPLGPNTLEENWTTASNGNIASMVRM